MTERIEPPHKEPLFVPNLPARRTDPITSKMAAEAILGDRKRLGELQRRALLLVKKHPHLTAQELSRVAQDKDPAKTRRRLSELCDSGHIKVFDTRKCEVTGRMAQTYEYVPKSKRKPAIKKLSRDEAIKALLKYAVDPCKGDICVCGYIQTMNRAKRG